MLEIANQGSEFNIKKGRKQKNIENQMVYTGSVTITHERKLQTLENVVFIGERGQMSKV